MSLESAPEKSILLRYEGVVYFLLILLNAFLILPSKGSLGLYLDNPAHLAELHELAFGTSTWSEIGFLGFPLGQLHSPLWYGLLAFLIRHGADAELVYQGATYFGIIAAPLAILWVSRKFAPLWFGFLISLQVLLLHHSVSGLGSVTGGMWTFYIACGLAVLLLERLSRPYTKRLFAEIGLLSTFIGLTHFFVCYYVGILLMCMAILACVNRANRRDLVFKAFAVITGLVGAAWYWAPTVLAPEAQFLYVNRWPADRILNYFLFGIKQVRGLDLGHIEGSPFALKNLPAQTIFILGLIGFYLSRKKGSLLNKLNTLSVISLIALMSLSSFEKLMVILGPVPWRFCTLVALGLAISELGLYRHFTKGVWTKGGAAITLLLSIVSIGATLICREPLFATLPSPQAKEYSDIQQLWKYLREELKPERLYVQDTFWTNPQDREFIFSHVLTLTSKETGHQQAGAYYGIVPYRTQSWLVSEMALLAETTLEHFDRIKARIKLGGFRHIVLSSPEAKAVFLQDPDHKLIYEIGNFSVVEVLSNAHEGLVVLNDKSLKPEVSAFQPGKIELKIPERTSDLEFTLRESFHDFWTLDGCDQAKVKLTEHGLMSIQIPKGQACTLHAEFRPMKWNMLVSLIAVMSFVSILVVQKRGI